MREQNKHNQDYDNFQGSEPFEDQLSMTRKASLCKEDYGFCQGLGQTHRGQARSDFEAGWNTNYSPLESQTYKSKS